MESPRPRALRRSRSNRVIAGVCGGLGEYLGVDPVLIRIAAVVLVFVGGAGLIAYLVAWIAMPLAPEGDASAPPIRRATLPDDNGRAGVIAGAVLVAIGGLLLIDLVAPISIDHRYLWPLLLIVVGATIIARGGGR